MDTSSNKKTAKDNVQLDQGWSWVVLFSTTIIMSSIPAIPHIFAILFKDILTSLDIGATTVAWVFNSNTLFLNLIGIICPALALYVGHKLSAIIFGLFLFLGLLLSSFSTHVIHLFLTFGFLAGVGAGVCSVISFLISVSYFEKYRGLAIGCVTGSASVGRIITPYLVNYLVSEYGGRGTVLIYSGITLHVIPAALTFRPLPKRPTEHEAPTEGGSCTRFTTAVLKSIDFKLLKNPMFLAVICLDGIAWMVFLNTSMLLPTYLESLGLGIHTPLFLTVMPCADLAARLLVPLLTDWKVLSIVNAYLLGPLFATLGLAGLLILTSSLPWLLFTACVYSLGTGVLNSMYGMLMVYFFTVERLPSCLGLSNVSKGIFSQGAGVFVGYLQEQMQNSIGSIMFMCGLTFLLGVIFSFQKCINRYNPYFPSDPSTLMEVSVNKT